jgi:hypothetical protein
MALQGAQYIYDITCSSLRFKGSTNFKTPPFGADCCIIEGLIAMTTDRTGQGLD